MQYKELKDKAKKLGLRVTKDVRGRRVKLTAKELRSKISLNFENSVRNAQRVIRLCQTVVAPVSMTGVPPPPPPPPPPPKKPVINATRAKLMAELKNKLKKRGMNK
jgi:hypothetical protein|tara:strand:- start:1796 stop:2113 length:318 start_codon:yes stop_codon:yes gene_type:complete